MVFGIQNGIPNWDSSAVSRRCLAFLKTPNTSKYLFFENPEPEKVEKFSGLGLCWVGWNVVFFFCGSKRFFCTKKKGVKMNKRKIKGC